MYSNNPDINYYEKRRFNYTNKIICHRCIKLAVALPKTALGNHIKGQLIRCGTSVSANYRAACHGQTKAVFIHKIGIVIEEADVRQLADWLEFIIDEKLKTKKMVEDLRKEAYELTSIFIKSRKTAQKNL